MEVHFCFSRLNDSKEKIKRLEAYLSPEERTRAKRFHFDKDRNEFILSHGTLRILLSKYLQKKPQNISFIQGEHGKPFLSHTENTSLQFNMSHSSGLAVYAFTKEKKIGVDVEWIERKIQDKDAIAKRFFSSEEIEAYLAIEEALRLEAFFNCWTRKESFIKAIGEGLTCPLNSFQVSLNPGNSARLIAIKKNQKKAKAWTMYSLEPLPGYKAAVTMEGKKNQFINQGEFTEKKAKSKFDRF